MRIRSEHPLRSFQDLASGIVMERAVEIIERLSSWTAAVVSLAVAVNSDLSAAPLSGSMADRAFSRSDGPIAFESEDIIQVAIIERWCI